MKQATLMEQRCHDRIPVSIPVKIICENQDIYMAQVNCLSKGGFLCAMKKSLPINSKIKITFLLPPFKDSKQSQSIGLSGEVVRENLKESFSGDIGHTVAIRFLKISDECRELIMSYLNSMNKTNQSE